MVDLYIDGDKTLITHIFNTHFEDSISFLVSKLNISREDARDSCMDAIINFCDRIRNRKIEYGNLRFLFTRIAVSCQIDKFKKDQKVKDAVFQFTENKVNDHEDLEHYFQVLDKAVEKLKPDSRHFIRDVYYHKKSMVAMAEESNTPPATLRKRKQRILVKIKEHFFNLLD